MQMLFMILLSWQRGADDDDDDDDDDTSKIGDPEHFRPVLRIGHPVLKC